MRVAVFALPILFVLPAAAFAQGQMTTPTSPTTTATTNPGKPGAGDPNKMVCKTFDATGSRLSKRRECHTQAEWTEIAAIERRALDQRQANRYNGNQ